MLKSNKIKTKPAGWIELKARNKQVIEPDNASRQEESRMERAKLYLDQGREQYRHYDMIGARQSLSASVNEDPTLQEAKMKLHYVTEEIDDIADELNELRPALEKSPDDPELNYRVGKLTFLLGHTEEGTKLLNKAGTAVGTDIAEKAKSQLHAFGVQ